MIEYVKFNDYNLSDRWSIVDVVRNPSQMTLKTQVIQGRPGAAFLGASPALSTVQFTALVKGRYSQDRREELRKLRQVLQTDVPRPLEFSDDQNKYYMAILSSIKETQYKRATAWVVTMSVQPILYGTREHVRYTTHTQSAITGWPSSAAQTIETDGTATTYPVVVIGGAKPDSGGHVAVTLDDLYTMRVKLDVSTGVQVEIHCDPNESYVMVGDEYHMITTDSKWWEFAPGEHTYNLTSGNGSSLTVSWYDRWAV